MPAFPLPKPPKDDSPELIKALLKENAIFRKEIRVAREAAEITASLVVKQFEETERVLQKLQNANAQRKAVLDSATQIAIIATNMNGTISVFNTGAENLLQYRADEVIEKATPEIFLLESELERHRKAIRLDTGHDVKGHEVFLEYARQGRKEQQEWTYVRKDGTRFPAVLSISALCDPEGIIYGFLCVAMDVTEKKRSEKALAESEANYRFLIDNIPNIVFRGYADGSLDLYDDKIETMTGYRKELFASRQIKWFDLIVEEDLPHVRQKFINALKSNKSYIREYRIRKKDGEIIWIEACSKIVCDEEGNIDFVTGSFLDVTERKRSEYALHDSEEKYRSLFISGPNPIFVLDRKTLEILDASPSAEETYGYYKEELVGRNFEELGTFEYEDESLSLVESKSWSDTCVFSQRIKHFRQGGEPFYVEVKACPTTYQGRPAIILAASDITEIIEKDAQLFQASKMTTLGEMSAGIAHELNQPLNAIKIGSDFLKKQIEQNRHIPANELHQVVSAVSTQVNRASEIIQSLREFGRKPDFRKEKVDVNATIKDVMKIIGQQLNLQNIKVLYDLAENAPPILANKNRLEQVIFNLVTNARDAIQAQSNEKQEENVIVISTWSEQKTHLNITISDTGTGIPEKNVPKIFEPFYTTKEVGKGMGLGLSITYGIIRDFEGTINVESQPGGGSRFHLRFPSGIKG
ncbi:MAG: PAS domain S-box protein [Deltaproteobacteria bacterium]|nr:PAS domain S-box protein [Deltaproteobacteria bacterium]